MLVDMKFEHELTDKVTKDNTFKDILDGIIMQCGLEPVCLHLIHCLDQLEKKENETK